jgi:hypothetical protein
MAEINLDDSDLNADWIKSRIWDLPTSLTGLLDVVGVGKLDHFLTLPAAKPMPEELRTEVLKFMGSEQYKEALKAASKDQ